MTLATGVRLPETGIIEICRRYGVKELSVFGSAARGELRPDSDVDFLVDFLPDARPVYWVYRLWPANCPPSSAGTLTWPSSLP